MKIEKSSNGSSLKLAIEGRLETTTAPELDAIVKNELSGITDLTFDFSKLDYISSAGLRVMLSAHKIMIKQGKMKICGVNDIVREIFDITGFSDIFTIE